MSRPERSDSPDHHAHSPDASFQGSPALQTAIVRLEQAVTQIQDSEAFRSYLSAQARFHAYSWGNVLLIAAQRPDATRVAGFHTWKGLDRHVRKGEHGLKIIVPHVPSKRAGAEITSTDTLTGQDTVEAPAQTQTSSRRSEPSRLRPTSARRFRVGTVFDPLSRDFMGRSEIS